MEPVIAVVILLIAFGLFVSVAFVFGSIFIAWKRATIAEVARLSQRHRFLPAVLAILAIAVVVVANASFISSLIFGRSPVIADGLKELTGSDSYGIRVIASGFVTLVVDIRLTMFLRRMSKNKKVPNQPSQTTPPGRRV